MYIRANSDGTFTNGPLFYNQIHFEKKSEIFKGIEEFVRNMLDSAFAKQVDLDQGLLDKS
jgi:hypothetical protein